MLHFVVNRRPCIIWIFNNTRIGPTCKKYWENISHTKSPKNKMVMSLFVESRDFNSVKELSNNEVSCSVGGYYVSVAGDISYNSRWCIGEESPKLECGSSLILSHVLASFQETNVVKADAISDLFSISATFIISVSFRINWSICTVFEVFTSLSGSLTISQMVMWPSTWGRRVNSLAVKSEETNHMTTCSGSKTNFTRMVLLLVLHLIQALWYALIMKLV